MTTAGDGVRRLLTRAARALGQTLVAAAGVGLLAAASGVVILTQTATGRRTVSSFLERTLEGTVNGSVTVGPITGGNLVTRAVLDRFRIAGPEGEPFLELRGVRVSYNPLGLLRGQYHLRRLRADSVRLFLEQERDGSWNYQRIFTSTEPDTASDTSGARLWITDALMGGGRVVVRTPWEPDVAAASRDSAVAAALAGESLWRYERAEVGIDRVVALAGARARLPYFRIVDPGRPMRLELRGLEALARVVTQDLPVERLDADVTFGDTIRIDLPVARTRHTRLAGEGWVVPEDPPRYRFDLGAERLGFEDLRWLPVPVPDSGGGPAGLTIRTSADPEVVAVDVADADVRSGDSHATGGFSLFLEETPVLSGVDLELRPLRLELAAELLDRDTMPDGLVRGTVRGSGPIDLFGVDADVTLEPLSEPEPPAAPGPSLAGPPRPTAPRPSHLTARGGIGLVGDPRAMRGLRLGFDDFELRWTRLIEIDTRQPGRISGTATLDRIPGGRIGFEADVRHRFAEADSASHLTGSGSFEPGEPPSVALDVRVDPLSLRLLDPYFPAVELMGWIRGPASLSGTLAELRARADLETPRGQLQFDGTFDVAADRKRYDARLTARGIQLAQWLRDAPPTRLDVRGEVRGAGTDPATLEASFDLAILPSVFDEARVDSSLVRFSVSEGLARVDSFAIRTDVGTVRGRGGFGLAEDRSASLFLDVDVPRLSEVNRWLVPGRGPVAEDTTARDLFAEFPVEGRPEEAAFDTLAGSLTGRGVLYGNTSSFGFGGRLDGVGVGYGEIRADSLRGTLQAPDARELDEVVVNGTGWGLSGAGLRADSVALRVARGADRRSEVRFLAVRGDDATVSARGDVLWEEARKEASVTELTLGLGDQRLVLTDPASLVYGEEGLTVRGFRLAGEDGALLRADGSVPRGGAVDFDLAVERIRLAAVRSFLALEPEFGGTLGARVRLTGRASAPVMEGSVEVAGSTVQGRSLGRLAAELGYEDRVLRTDASLEAEGVRLLRLDGLVRVDLAPWATGDRLPGEPLDLTLTADSLPLALPLLPVSSLREVEGVATGSVRVRGSFDRPALDGSVSLRRGSARVPALGIRVERVRGHATLEGSEARLDSLLFASARGGSGRASGTIGLREPTNPSLALDLTARWLRAIEVRKYSLEVDGSGRLEGSYRRPNLTGRFQVADGTIRVPDVLGGEDVVDLTDPDLVGLVDTTALAERRVLERARNPFLQHLRADVDLLLGPDLWVRSANLNVEIEGDVDLQMDRAEGDLRLYGDVRLVRGNYRWTGARGFVSRQLRIQEGRIVFVGTPGMNPNLDITAMHRVRTGRVGTLVVRAHVTGTMLDPQLALTSEPSMSESDQVCVLLINSPCTAPGAGQLARDQLLGRVSSELSSALAPELGADYLEVRSGAPRAVGEGDEADGPSRSLFSEAEVEAGWYLSPELFLTVTYPFGRPFPEGSLDWRFTDQWTLQLLTELRFQNGFRSTATSNLERNRTWGLFLFREWSF